jgi:uncharacterized DUF497 family protein
MGSVIDGFDWDDANREKCSKHGVTIAEIGALLSGLPDVALDLRHSEMEVRLIARGQADRNVSGRPMFVAFAIRTRQGRGLLRPISARYMHAKEIRACGEAESA